MESERIRGIAQLLCLWLVLVVITPVLSSGPVGSIKHFLQGKVNGGVAAVKIDPSTNAIATVDFEHVEIHGGSHYFVKDYVDVDGDGTVVYMGFTTPDTTKWIHAHSSIIGEAEFQVEIYEGATVSSTGVPLTPINNNRNSTNTAGLFPFAAPTVTDEGTRIWNGVTGAGRYPSAVSAEFGFEIVAKQNTIYLFKLTKVSPGTHYIDTNFWWYEHTNKN